MTAKLLTQIAASEEAFEGIRGAGVVSAEDKVAVGEKTDAAPIAMLGRRVIVEELRTAFILPHLHMSVVGNDSNKTIVADLMDVIGLRAPCLVDGQHSFGIRGLVAGVAIGRQAEAIADPASKVSRAIRA